MGPRLTGYPSLPSPRQPRKIEQEIRLLHGVRARGLEMPGDACLGVNFFFCGKVYR